MYHFGSRSKREIKGLHPDLISVLNLSIRTTAQDYSAHDGLRELYEQVEYVAAGVSRTMNSKHLIQPDGYGHAVDLVPVINGKLRWEWPAIYRIAYSMRNAADALKVDIRWGGCWKNLRGTEAPIKSMVEEYVARKRAEGRDAFPDGPHYELMK